MKANSEMQTVHFKRIEIYSGDIKVKAHTPELAKKIVDTDYDDALDISDEKLEFKAIYDDCAVSDDKHEYFVVDRSDLLAWQKIISKYAGLLEEKGDDKSAEAEIEADDQVIHIDDILRGDCEDGN